ncbi:MAG: endolytic transglycosylase MltG [Butyrivibrio sp.]|nr:endolytic transglycosylase MltG [Butyrivibrio sp.]
MRGTRIGLSIVDTVVRVVILVIAVMLIWRGSQTAYKYGYRIYKQTAVSSVEGKTATVTITEDMSVKDIADLLKAKGLIADTQLFYFQEMFSVNHGRIMPGTYELDASMTPEEMIVVMSASYVEAEETEEE